VPAESTTRVLIARGSVLSLSCADWLVESLRQSAYANITHKISVGVLSARHRVADKPASDSQTLSPAEAASRTSTEEHQQKDTKAKHVSITLDAPALPGTRVLTFLEAATHADIPKPTLSQISKIGMHSVERLQCTATLSSGGRTCIRTLTSSLSILGYPIPPTDIDVERGQSSCLLDVGDEMKETVDAPVLIGINKVSSSTTTSNP
jgi:hypothetical protein